MTSVFVETLRGAAFFFKSFVLTTSILILCVSQVLVFAQDSPDSEALYASGLNKYRSCDYVGAVSDLERFIAAVPESPKRNQAELYLGAAYLARGGYQDRAEFARAQQCFNYVLSQGEKAPFYREAFFHSCRISYKTQAYRQALVLVKEFLRLYPNDPFSGYAYYYAGDCATQLNETEEALSCFEAGSRFNDSPFCWDSVVRRAEIFVAQGRYVEADQELKRLETSEGVSSSASSSTPSLRAKFFIAQGRYDEAISYLESYSQGTLADSNGELRAVLALFEAQARYYSGDLVGAKSCVKRCEESTTPALAGAGLLKIKLALAENRVDEAAQTLKLLAESEFGANDRDVIAVVDASIQLAKGKYDEVIASLIETLKARSDVGARVLFQYYDVRKSNRLEPEEFVDACETLTFAFIQRAKEQKDPAALQSQEAVFQATLNYATSLGNPFVARKVVQIDRKRQKKLEELKRIDFSASNEQKSPQTDDESNAPETSPAPLATVESQFPQESIPTELPQAKTPNDETSAPKTSVPSQSEETKTPTESANQETTSENASSTVAPREDK